MSHTRAKPDLPVVLLSLIAFFSISLLLQNLFSLKNALLFIIGTGLGISLLHAAYGFSGAWRDFIRKRMSRGFRSHIWLIALTSLLFFPIIGGAFSELQASAALAPIGLSVAIGAFIFGIGMQLGGGCGSGTLFTVGGGHVNMLVTLMFFIIGATTGSVHLGWWLSLPDIGKVSSITSFGWLPALLLQLALLTALYFLLRKLEHNKHGKVQPLIQPATEQSFLNQLIFGPWPLWWAVISLTVLNLLIMLLAGHAWSITFAFGLWGTKIWMALGGDISSWTYWASGYPARALNNSVLADTTSIINFGIIAGAILAAALAGHFAPEKTITKRLLVISAIGGLCLGYGARLAFGCNIGGLLAGMATGSLHGWLWLVTGFSGAIAGVYLRVWFKLDKPVKA